MPELWVHKGNHAHIELCIQKCILGHMHNTTWDMCTFVCTLLKRHTDKISVSSKADSLYSETFKAVGLNQGYVYPWGYAEVFRGGTSTHLDQCFTTWGAWIGRVASAGWVLGGGKQGNLHVTCKLRVWRRSGLNPRQQGSGMRLLKGVEESGKVENRCSKGTDKTKMLLGSALLIKNCYSGQSGMVSSAGRLPKRGGFFTV